MDADVKCLSRYDVSTRDQPYVTKAKASRAAGNCVDTGIVEQSLKYRTLTSGYPLLQLLGVLCLNSCTSSSSTNVGN